MPSKWHLEPLQDQGKMMILISVWTMNLDLQKTAPLAGNYGFFYRDFYVLYVFMILISHWVCSNLSERPMVNLQEKWIPLIKPLRF